MNRAVAVSKGAQLPGPSLVLGLGQPTGSPQLSACAALTHRAAMATPQRAVDWLLGVRGVFAYPQHTAWPWQRLSRPPIGSWGGGKHSHLEGPGQAHCRSMF